MRIRVIDVLDLLATGLSSKQILEEMPDLEDQDLKACIAFARRRLDHSILRQSDLAHVRKYFRTGAP
jgi:uncharacterized protein (DUF433 family)